MLELKARPAATSSKKEGGLENGVDSNRSVAHALTCQACQRPTARRRSRSRWIGSRHRSGKRRRWHRELSENLSESEPQAEPEPESEPEPTCGLIKIIEAINELQYYIDIEQLEDWQQEATIVYIEQYGCGERNAQGTVSWLDTSQFVATDEEEEAAEDDAAEEEAEEAEEADEE